MRVRVRVLTAIAALAQAIAIGGATPIELGHSLAARSQVCGNAPSTVAGTMLYGVADNLKLPKRVKNVLWCCPGTETYITFAVTHRVDPEPLWHILHDAYNHLLGYVLAYGDAVMDGGMFVWPAPDHMILRIWNANNHQTTWGVMASAIFALADWMHTEGIFGGGTFNIYDGQNQVGTGTIGGI